MKRFNLCIILFLTIISSSFATEYQMSINDSLTYSGKTITVKNIGMGGVIFDVSGTEATISTDDPQKFDNIYISPEKIFYVKEKDERYAIINFCEKQKEVCNNIDDDCDGKVDEGVTRKCGNTEGICAKGTQSCVEGEWGYCLGATYSQSEICNGLDDDCDGVIDEGLIRSCGGAAVLGACTSGIQDCIDGKWADCEGEVYPKPETCNNADEDCDGEVDEELVKTCGVSDVGACTKTDLMCSSGKWEACNAVLPTDEKCDDNIDNNCDGVVDEGCVKEEVKKKGVFSRIIRFIKGFFD